MNTQQQHKLIAKLKQLPKQGMPAQGEPGYDQAQELIAQLEILARTIPTITELTDTYASSMKQLNTDFAQASMGANKLIGIHALFSTQIKNLVKNKC